MKMKMKSNSSIFSSNEVANLKCKLPC